MTKDYLKFRNAIKKDNNLSLEESYLLEILFDYYNADYGYAFPSYDVLMNDLKTKRRAKVSKLLKSLVKKGYILIQKAGKKNTYKLLKYLFINNKNKKNNQKGYEQMTMENVITEEEQKLIDISDITHRQAKNLLEMSKNRVNKVLEYLRYAIKRDVSNIYAYVKKLIEVNADVGGGSSWNESLNSGINPKSFNNFEPRQYDYDDLEWRLLGWRD